MFTIRLLQYSVVGVDWDQTFLFRFELALYFGDGSYQTVSEVVKHR